MILEMVAEVSGLTQWGLMAFANTASHRYKVYKIPKKKGGTRTVEQPSKEVKFLQRVLIEMLFSRLPVHSAATAYVKGKGIAHNANQHVRSKYFVKFDFSDFFPSIKAHNIQSMLKRNLEARGINLPASDLTLITNICCKKGQLVIGAPSSPILSNLIMYEFDKEFAERMANRGVVYTRYADDICLSSEYPNRLSDCDKEIMSVLSDFTDLKLKLNTAKTVHVSKKKKVIITGVTVTSDSSLSVGRVRKKFLRAKIHRALTGNLSPEHMKSLAGEIAYIDSIESGFYRSLIAKYGDELKNKLNSANWDAKWVKK
ncbi:retron St85 family RNA-directed DNA polymerase [Bdellovibrio sp. BCCA]|uniref:retron St85 family RNA-directed DNA polymerase n=1 Tax=Bdellovibrio sp. BCCA TaxID=3136281 RepID=UPI0030F33DCB